MYVVHSKYVILKYNITYNIKYILNSNINIRKILKNNHLMEKYLKVDLVLLYLVLILIMMVIMVAVGALYEKGIGAIYIFNGNSNGLLRHYSQRIIGKQFAKNIREFRISISEPCDINGDKYPDIAIGAYLSELF